MPPVTLRTKRLSVTAELPEAVASRLGRVRDRLRPTQSGGPEGPTDPAPMPGHLVIADSLPELRLDHPDPHDSVAVFRTRNQPTPPASTSALARRVSEVWWYHTIELPEGIVTAGIYDHRPLVPNYGVPASLEGKRVLDVASWDGFWAFEFERRGGQVVGVDVARMSDFDFPPSIRAAFMEAGLDRSSRAGFDIAREALESQVERVEGSVYDLDPSWLGTFDFVHSGDLLLHLESPSAALRAIRRVTDGTALIADCIEPSLQGQRVTRYLGGWGAVHWWLPSLDTLAQMVLDAGFADVRLHAVYNLAPRLEGTGPWRAALLATT